MYTHEQERPTQQEEAVHEVYSKVEGTLRACEEHMHRAEHMAKEAAYRAEELKLRRDGRGYRPRRPAKRAWAA
jgi:hypothetical protein